jgi:glutathione peroxidase
MAKSDVKGGDANEAYQYLTKNKNGGAIPWNFTKFLVNKDGDVVGYYGPQASPESIIPDIETLIAA